MELCCPTNLPPPPRPLPRPRPSPSLLLHLRPSTSKSTPRTSLRASTRGSSSTPPPRSSLFATFANSNSQVQFSRRRSSKSEQAKTRARRETFCEGNPPKNMEATGGSGGSATQYDVFLSFRGSDTRNTFTDCLYRTMVDKDITAYRDSEELHAGDRIGDLLTAVGNSKICILVLSKNYASSAWCLRELARVMELNESTRKPEILPIFFDVTPTDVKLRTELYVEDLEKHEGRYGAEMRQRWEAALRNVGEIKGWEVQGKPYGEVIDLVVKEVLRKLTAQQRPLGRRTNRSHNGVDTFYFFLSNF